MVVRVNVEKELQNLNNDLSLNENNAIEIAVPSTSKIITEQKLQNLNNDLRLNENNVIEMMSKIIPSVKNSSDVNALYSDNTIDDNYHLIPNYTLLHIAVRFDCDKIARLLIAIGADVNLQDFDGCTSLHYAAIYGRNIAIAKALIETGANVNEKNYFEKEPLYYALQDNNIRPANFPIAKLLLNNNADRSYLHTYINETSKRKCMIITFITSAVVGIITPFIFKYNTNISVPATIGGTILSMLSVGAIAHKLAYTWAQHAVNSKLDKISYDDASSLFTTNSLTYCNTDGLGSSGR